MPALVGDQQQVATHLEQRADEKNQVPSVHHEEIDEHDELALDQDQIHRRLHKFPHPAAVAAACGRSRTCCAMSDANRSSPLIARRRNNSPGAPMARSARPASLLTCQLESRRHSASCEPDCQCCIRPRACAAAARTPESGSFNRVAKRSADNSSPIAPRTLVAATRTPTFSLAERRFAAGRNAELPIAPATRSPDSAGSPV